MKKVLSLAVVLCLALAYTPALASAPQPIPIAAAPTPYAEILGHARDDLAELGYELDITGFVEFVLIYPVLSAEELDAAFLQGMSELDTYNGYAPQSEQLAAAFAVCYAPFGLYAGQSASLAELDEGSVIRIPDDPDAESRALSLLFEAGLIELSEDAAIDPRTLTDITANPLKLDILKGTAAKNADLIVMSAESAKKANLTPTSDALFLEAADSPAALRHAEYIVVRKADIGADFVIALERALLTQKVHDFILTNEAYGGTLVPMFSVEDEKPAG